MKTIISGQAKAGKARLNTRKQGQASAVQALISPAETLTCILHLELTAQPGINHFASFIIKLPLTDTPLIITMWTCCDVQGAFKIRGKEREEKGDVTFDYGQWWTIRPSKDLSRSTHPVRSLGSTAITLFY